MSSVEEPIDLYGIKKLTGVDREGVCIDLGAGYGAFATLWHSVFPASLIVCVEQDPRKVQQLEASVKEFATIIPAWATYLSWRPLKPAAKVSLHDIFNRLQQPQPGVAPHMQEQFKKHWISCIKFNVGGHEFEILENVSESIMWRTQYVVGQLHDNTETGIERFLGIWKNRFPYWATRAIDANGIFSARNPYYAFRRRCEP